MKKDKVNIEVAYICNGKDRSCTKDSCYYKNHGSCMHTTNPKYAKYGPVSNPRAYPDRFDKFRYEVTVRYYERRNQDDQ